jgi:hypothetical protein
MKPELIMSQSYSYNLVALSIFISVLAAYGSRALEERIHGRSRSFILRHPDGMSITERIKAREDL